MSNSTPYNTYFNEINIFDDKEQLLLNAYLYIDENNYCEGICYKEDNVSFIFGYFKKFDFIDLYEIGNDNKIKNYIARKKGIPYKGKQYDVDCINHNFISSINLKVKELETDPRESFESPKEVFKLKVDQFKNEFFKDKKKCDSCNFLIQLLSQKYSGENLSKKYRKVVLK